MRNFNFKKVSLLRSKNSKNCTRNWRNSREVGLDLVLTSVLWYCAWQINPPPISFSSRWLPRQRKLPWLLRTWQHKMLPNTPVKSATLWEVTNARLKWTLAVSLHYLLSASCELYFIFLSITNSGSWLTWLMFQVWTLISGSALKAYYYLFSDLPKTSATKTK